jgi:excisionase family DNA binding protein
MQQQGGLNAPAVGGPPTAPEILTPADVARVLGVSEADVIATIDAGELKGKKIGSAYRVTRAALDEFLKH